MYNSIGIRFRQLILCLVHELLIKKLHTNCLLSTHEQKPFIEVRYLYFLYDALSLGKRILLSLNLLFTNYGFIFYLLYTIFFYAQIWICSVWICVIFQCNCIIAFDWIGFPQVFGTITRDLI